MKKYLVLAISIITLSFCCVCSKTIAQQKSKSKEMMVIEIRSYNLKPGKRDEFHQLVSKTVPLLKLYKIEVVAHGASLHDESSYFLMRSFASVEERTTLEDAFYGSDDWKNGSREAVLSMIKSYTTVVIPIKKNTIHDMAAVLIGKQ